jgi:RNA polymerase sigma-70 factor (ECF subfamily)
LAESDDETDANASSGTIAGDNPLEELTRNEMIDALRNSILALPAHYREVVVLCDLHEMSYIDAAKVVGCAVGTVRSRLHRARALLIEKMRAGRDRGQAADEVKRLRCFA